MKLVTTKAIAKVAAVAAGLAMFASVSTFALDAQASALTASQVSAIVSLLQSFGADSATIANVQASLTGGTVTTTTTSSTSSSCNFTVDLTVGSTGAQVTCLQNALIAAGYSIPAGATGYFGAQTVAAVSAWQRAAGVTPTAGYFGAKSRAAFTLGGSGSTTTTTTGTGTVTVGSGNGLKVSLSPTSPSGSVLVQGQGIGDLADFVFANPTSNSITVTGLTFNRIGVSNDQTINNVYLYNGVNRITDSAGVSNSQFAFTNAGGLFVVPAGTTYTVSVRADIATGTSGQQIGASLVSVSQTGTLDSSDSFPVNSGYQTISAANLASVAFNTSTLPSGSGLTVSPQSSYTVWQNSVSVSTNPVWLKAMTFTNLGSIDSNSIGNFRLYVDGNQVGTAVSSFNSGRKVTFDLSANPVKLSTQSHVIKVLADVTGGASLTFQLSVQRSSDALFVDSQLNQPITPTSNGSANNFSAVNASQVTVNAVNGSTGISVSKDPTSATQSVSKGATNVNFATFNMLASGEPTKVNDIFVCANTETAGVTGAGGGLANGKIYFNGVQVGSTKAIVECNTTAAGTDFSLGSSLILPAGQQALVSVYADANTGVATSSVSANTNLPNGNNVQIRLVAGSSNAQGQNSLQSANVPVGNTDGNQVSIAAASLTASKYSGYANQTIIPGSQNALIGEFTLAAGSTEGVNVNTIGVNASTTWAPYIQNLKLVDMSTGTQLGTTISTPSGAAGDSPNSFSLGSNLTIPASGSKTIGIYANLLSTAGSASQTTLGISASGTSGTGVITGNSVSVTAPAVLQSISTSGGSLSVSLGASNPVAANVIAGASSVKAGSFTFTGNNSSYTVQKLQVDVTNAASAAITSVSLTDSSGNVIGTLSGASSVGTATTSYSFTGLNLNVPANTQTDISVWVGTPTISAGGASVSGLKISATLDGGQGFQAQDQAGNLTTTFGGYAAGFGPSSNANTGYGTLVVRKSIPTFAMLASGSTVPTSSQSLYKFSIAADPAGAVDIDQLTFNIATSGPSLTNLSLLDVTSGSSVQIGTLSSLAGTTAVFNFGSTTQQIGAGQTKTYQLIATVSGWATNGSLSISLAQDTTYVANTNASALTSNKVIWSDRSATGHTSDTQDYTNGYLLKDFLSNVTTYTHN